MRVPAGQAVRMFDANEISISAVPTCRRHNTIRDGNNWTACWSCVIRREMRPFRSQNRVHASMRKTGADSWSKLQGRSEHGTLERQTLLVVVGVSEQKTSIPPPGIHELRCPDLSVLYKVPVVNGFVDDQPYLVAGLDLRAEVDLPLKDLSKLGREILALGEVS